MINSIASVFGYYEIVACPKFCMMCNVPLRNDIFMEKKGNCSQQQGIVEDLKLTW